MAQEPPKKVQIRDYWREHPDATSTEVADAFDTSGAYARRHKPDDLKQAPNGSGSSSGSDTGALELGESTMTVDGPAADDAPDTDSDPFDGLRELTIDDVHDEYECGECEAPVEYLQETCGECGEELAWWST